MDDLRRRHREIIVGAGLTIAVAGAISARKAGEAIDRLLAGLPDGNDRKAAPLVVQADFSPKTILLHRPDASKSMLGFFGRLPPLSEGGDLTDRLALSFFARPKGPLMEAVRTRLRAGYHFGAGITSHNRAIRLLSISGEVEGAKLEQAAELILRRYEDYRTKPDLDDFPAMRRGVAGRYARQSVDTAANNILELVLDGHDACDAPRLDEIIDAVKLDIVQDRLSSLFPPSEDLIIVAVSPDADALPGACIITEIEQVKSCPSTRSGSTPSGSTPSGVSR
ncbi:MAG: insulinase family protein [Ectothiorhodospiraceae bacterium AqS1]|nr:insulinase family protein [Ectothiorhodospiraceae bacterium AqS1]